MLEPAAARASERILGDRTARCRLFLNTGSVFTPEALHPPSRSLPSLGQASPPCLSRGRLRWSYKTILDAGVWKEERKEEERGEEEEEDKEEARDDLPPLLNDLSKGSHPTEPQSPHLHNGNHNACLA